jgi:prevent-host-death family protein
MNTDRGSDISIPTTSSLPLSDVRENLRAIVDEVLATGTEFTITRHGKPVAVLMSFDEYESMIETLNILSDDEAMSAIAEAEAEMRKTG